MSQEDSLKPRWDDIEGGAVPIQRVLARELSDSEKRRVSGGYFYFVSPTFGFGQDVNA
jgi:hypothetical protein